MCKKHTAMNHWGDDDLILYRISNSVCTMKKLVSLRCRWLYCQLLNLSINELLRLCHFHKENLFGFMAKLCSIEWDHGAVQSNLRQHNMANHLISCIDINERQHMCLLYDKPIPKLLTLFIAYGSYCANVINKNTHELVHVCAVLGVCRTFSKSKIRST